ncbi:MAG: ATP-binding protein [Marinisporobacter sp.]|jgi:signal transduction histidine kinase|nr:ATP-binding protein [Marinisporobacter sp.]
MNKKGIVFKLFFMTVSVFILFLFIQVGFQSIFLEKFYLNNKIKNTQKNIEKFSESYVTANWNRETTIKKINSFMERNNTPIIIVNNNGIPEYNNETTHFMTIRTDEGEIFQVDLDYLSTIDAIDPFDLQIGNQIILEGIPMEGTNFLEVLSINNHKFLELNEYVEDITETEFEDDPSIKNVSGEIIYIHDSMDDTEQTLYKTDLLLTEIDSFFFDDKEKMYVDTTSSIHHYWFSDPISNTKNIIFYKPITIANKQKYLFAMTSLQPIAEAVQIINRYHVYTFLLAILLILILSFSYSKMIAKPLIHMNEVAKKMANLDFGTYCSIRTHDELGSLSHSLNTLSQNLESSLTELKEANVKLVNDIEKERQQELIRKEFVANVSHELKTPLGIMKGFAEGIKDGIYENKKEYYLDVIIDEIEKMNMLILDMLEVSKLESKAYKLSKDIFTIDGLILKVKAKFDHMFKEKDLTVHLNLKSYDVYGDLNKIEQVLINLFSNAIRHTPEKETISIQLIESLDTVYIHIENSGTHIPKEEIHKIWDRFYRVEKSRNKNFGGTGLGLLIVKNILELHGSTYGVKNTEKGVAFYFNLQKSSTSL